MAMPGAGGIISHQFKDLQSLFSSYMPFIRNGAIFIPNVRQQFLGKDVFVAITLPESSERMPLNGKVVWVNHSDQGNRPAGFAIQFGTDEMGLRVKNEIERLLAGKLDTDKPTYTL